MFWGLILEPNKRYSQTVEKAFHVSMASLNLTTADDSVVQVILYYEDTRYLLCNLKKSSTWQVPLDLNFQEGTTIAFVCHGHGQVHLTGYLIHSEDSDELEEEEEDEEEEEEEEAPKLVEKQSKRKPKDTLKNENKAKRLKQEIEVESSDEDIELDGINEENDSDESEEEDEESLNEEEDEDNEEDEEVKFEQKQQKKKEDKKLVNGKEVKQKKNKGDVQVQQNAQSEQRKKVVEGGVQIEELKIGSGPLAKSGKFISVYYVGRLKNGKKFDATTQGEGFKFRLGKGEVIKGWDVGIIGMKVGGKRRITIPSAMAYGAKGSPPVIPGNSTLIFEVELRNIH
ncbi:46 kDa FK506-binding nuclear protein [Ceratina calcarata]|uniref:peptidylprolyl isomerase n=1 Tax=Ceratina calcarata TaxID=156304 RepID=A0AAJ7NE24_9HYME|nr:46 kDa FK506-binding nuclear protein [Ceratina calcarata]